MIPCANDAWACRARQCDSKGLKSVSRFDYPCSLTNKSIHHSLHQLKAVTWGDAIFDADTIGVGCVRREELYFLLISEHSWLTPRPRHLPSAWRKGPEQIAIFRHYRNQSRHLHIRLLRAAGLSETGPGGALVHQSVQLRLVDSGHQVERYAARLEVLRQISE